MKHFSILAAAGLLLLGCRPHTALQQITTYSATYPDSALRALRTIPYERLSPTDQATYRIETEWCTFRTTQVLHLHSSLDSAITTSLSLDKAHFLLALREESQGNPYQAMLHLKQAEHALSAPSPLTGLIAYHMGQTSEMEMLLEVAHTYYLRAIDAFLPDNHTSRDLLYAYRDAARTAQDTVEQKRLFAEAHALATTLGDTLMISELRLQTLLAQNPRSWQEIHDELQADQGHRGGTLLYAESLLRIGHPDSCAHYLSIYAADTLRGDWYAERWHMLHAECLALANQFPKAYAETHRLYHSVKQQIEESAMSRTYTISRLYDLQASIEQNYLLRTSRQRLFISLLITLILLITSLFIAYWARQRMHLRHLSEIAKREQDIAALQAMNAAKRAQLRQTLLSRLQLTKQLHIADFIEQEESASAQTPEWARQYIEAALISSDSQAEQIRREFDSVSDGLLTRLLKQYPQLTEADLTMIALIILGLSVEDICILLNMPKRTIWTRRQRIRTRMGLPSTEAMDTYLLSLQ